jgi:hypothetical protein
MPENAAPAAPLSRRRAEGPCPPSFAQERLWFFDQFEPRSPVYHIARALHLDGPLDLGALQSALDMVAARHETIRTSLESALWAAAHRRRSASISSEWKGGTPGTVIIGKIAFERDVRGLWADAARGSPSGETGGMPIAAGFVNPEQTGR